MITYKDCPECGANKIHSSVRLCEICETCEKYESKITEALRERDEARAEVERRDREHEALLETAQKALAHVTAERDEARADVERLRSAYQRYGAAGVSEALKEISQRDGHPSDSAR